MNRANRMLLDRTVTRGLGVSTPCRTVTVNNRPWMSVLGVTVVEPFPAPIRVCVEGENTVSTCNKKACHVTHKLTLPTSWGTGSPNVVLK